MINRRLYNSIMEEYSRLRQKAAAQALQRREEIYRVLPRYKALEDEAADVAAAAGMSLIGADKDEADGIRARLSDRLSDIDSRKAALLKDAGYPSDYTAPVYSCPHCLDTGFIEDRPCQCLRSRLINEAYHQSHIEQILSKENFTHLTFEYYNKDELPFIRGLVEELKSYVSSFEPGRRSLFFWGNTGSGKTFFSNCVSKELLDRGYSVIYFTAHQLFDFMARHTFNRDHEDEDGVLFESSVEEIFDCDFLVIDDLGSELSNSFVSSRLFLILTERHQRGRSTLISTNLDMQRINDLYSERCTSRLLQDFNFYHFEGHDLRPSFRR